MKKREVERLRRAIEDLSDVVEVIAESVTVQNALYERLLAVMPPLSEKLGEALAAAEAAVEHHQDETAP